MNSDPFGKMKMRAAMMCKALVYLKSSVIYTVEHSAEQSAVLDELIEEAKAALRKIAEEEELQNFINQTSSTTVLLRNGDKINAFVFDKGNGMAHVFFDIKELGDSFACYLSWRHLMDLQKANKLLVDDILTDEDYARLAAEK